MPQLNLRELLAEMTDPRRDAMLAIYTHGEGDKHRKDARVQGPLAAHDNTSARIWFADGKGGGNCWPELQKWPEARHVTANNEDTYKPSYRMATMFVNDMFGPIQFRVLGLRRHVTEDEYIEIVRRSHTYFAAAFEREDEVEAFLVLFTDFRDVYDPVEWRSHDPL